MFSKFFVCLSADQQGSVFPQGLGRSITTEQNACARREQSKHASNLAPGLRMRIARGLISNHRTCARCDSDWLDLVRFLCTFSDASVGAETRTPYQPLHVCTSPYFHLSPKTLHEGFGFISRYCYFLTGPLVVAKLTIEPTWIGQGTLGSWRWRGFGTSPVRSTNVAG
jgi:hypothetical protein